jgi:hypothetical protein
VWYSLFDDRVDRGPAPGSVAGRDYGAHEGEVEHPIKVTIKISE